MYQKYKSAELVKPSGLDLKDRLVGVQRVTKVTKGGRAFGLHDGVQIPTQVKTKEKKEHNNDFPPFQEHKISTQEYQVQATEESC